MHTEQSWQWWSGAAPLDLSPHLMCWTIQVLADIHSRGGRSFGDLKPENILVVGKQLVLIDWCSSRDATQGYSCCRAIPSWQPRCHLQLHLAVKHSTCLVVQWSIVLWLSGRCVDTPVVYMVRQRWAAGSEPADALLLIVCQETQLTPTDTKTSCWLHQTRCVLHILHLFVLAEHSARVMTTCPFSYS